MSENMQRTWVTTAQDVLDHLKIPAAKRPETLALDITLSSDGTYERHYGRMEENDSAVVSEWAIATALAIATATVPDGFGDSLDVEHVQGKMSSVMAKNVKAGNIKGIASALKVLSTVVGNTTKSQQSALLHWLRNTGGSIRFVKRGSKPKGKRVAAATQTAGAPAVNADVLKALLESGMDASEAIELSRL